MNSQNNPKHTTIGLIKRLFKHTSRRRRYQFLFLLILTLISSMAEVVSLGALVPFIGILTDPEKIYNYFSHKSMLESLGIFAAKDLVLPLTIAFALAALLAGALRLLLSWVSIKLTNGIGTDLSLEVYRRTLFQPYKVHVARSSSEIISSITQKMGSATGMLLALMNVITSSTLFFSILITLLWIDPVVASVAMLSFGACYLVIALKTKARLRKNSQSISVELTNVVRALQEGLGAIREVLLDGTQDVYCDVYRKANVELQKAGGENNYINQAPRFVMEALGMVLIAIFAYFLSLRNGGIQSALPILGALALGAQRLLPLLQILYGNWTILAGSEASILDVLELLEQPLPEDADAPAPTPLRFESKIKLENVSFKYNQDGPNVLSNMTLEIPKGARIGFIGSTGSGKTTVLDLVMYLLEPSQGKIYIDECALTPEVRRAWQRRIAHVPQNIYLSDATIAENIAFGVPSDQIDMERVKHAATQAQIAEFIEERAEGYRAIVGERGVRLSGGQRQRIGIARALYKEATVLVFDEATSALDSQTEIAVMNSIENLRKDLTILIIAHRISTLKNCDSIIQLENGKIKAQGSYERFI